MTHGSSSPSDVAVSYLASFDGRDSAEIAAHVSADFVNEHTAALGSGCIGRAGYLDRLPGFLNSMPELHYRVEHLVASGSDVAVFYTMTGNFGGEHPFSIQGAQRLRVENGLIAHRTDYWDSAAFLIQVDETAATALAEFGIG